MNDVRTTTGPSPSPRLAYLVNEYPKTSHTFIRREILHLEERGYQILRVSIRPGETVVDPADLREAEKTIVVLGKSKAPVLLAAVVTALTRPVRFARALAMAWSMGRISERGAVRAMAYLAEAAFLLRLFHREGVEHVHVHFGTNGADAARLLRRLGGPTYSLTIHGPTDFDAPRGGSLGAKIHDAEFVSAITHYCVSQIRRWIEYTDWGKVHIVHCTVGDNFLGPVPPIADDADSLVCIGRLSAQKGHLGLVDAFARFKAEGGRGRLVLVGDGELRGVIEERIRKQGIEDAVEITGWVGEAEVRNRLEAARALVLPSFAEGLPVVIMEALALERPVITTYVAGIPELVKHGENGWLAVASDEDSLVAAMREAYAAPVERLRAMGKAGREAIRERHYAPTEAAKLDALFRRYVGTRETA